jgi:hypothetical protein
MLMHKLLHTGQVIIDLVMAVDKLPQPGGDVLAQSASFEAGGGFNVMAAAQRNGLPVVYLGRHGTGRFGDLAREAMKAEGIRIGIAHSAERDTGLCVAITDASAERSFVSYMGAEGEVTAEDLASVPAEAGDYVYVSGYSLLHVGKAQALVDWVLALPAGINVVFDPGPLVESPDAPLMQALLPRKGAGSISMASVGTCRVSRLKRWTAMALEMPMPGCLWRGWLRDYQRVRRRYGRMRRRLSPLLVGGRRLRLGWLRWMR